MPVCYAILKSHYYILSEYVEDPSSIPLPHCPHTPINYRLVLATSVPNVRPTVTSFRLGIIRTTKSRQTTFIVAKLVNCEG